MKEYMQKKKSNIVNDSENFVETLSGDKVSI